MALDPALVVTPALLAQQGIGVVAPFDFALDRELWRWMPDDVSLYMTRLPYVPVPVTVEMASALSDHSIVRQATRDVLTPEPRVVAYACASGSFVRGATGESRLTETMLSAGAPAAVTTSGGLAESLRLLDARRIAVVTPYIDSVTDRLVHFLRAHDVQVVSRVGLGLLSHIWKVGYGEIVEAVARVDRPEAEAVFISCTNVPTYDIIAPLERMLGKPVLTANQVTMCSALRAMGWTAAGEGQSLVRLSGTTAV
ncbi:maleate cis-trans isomerase family protein [Actinomadura rudentiformis]|uniref:Asp/Glu racemase n=1 Tax=Actinomadura rudentiformis TaxID=359158 RepID=A0A6H9YKP6_9ACTN|nr:Asp/Glu racemase [Actinomadura rudentiformis]KAB2345115.1 Asp/Glu racemase [Actinomadura rudentiformis]